MITGIEKSAANVKKLLQMIINGAKKRTNSVEGMPGVSEKSLTPIVGSNYKTVDTLLNTPGVSNSNVNFRELLLQGRVDKALEMLQNPAFTGQELRTRLPKLTAHQERLKRLMEAPTKPIAADAAGRPIRAPAPPTIKV